METKTLKINISPYIKRSEYKNIFNHDVLNDILSLTMKNYVQMQFYQHPYVDSAPVLLLECGGGSIQKAIAIKLDPRITHKQIVKRVSNGIKQLKLSIDREAEKMGLA